MQLAEVEHGTEFLSKTSLLQLLCSIIRCLSVIIPRVFAHVMDAAEIVLLIE